MDKFEKFGSVLVGTITVGCIGAMGYLACMENCESFQSRNNNPYLYESIDRCKDLKTKTEEFAEENNDIIMYGLLQKLDWCEYKKIGKKIWAFDRDARFFNNYLNKEIGKEWYNEVNKKQNGKKPFRY